MQMISSWFLTCFWLGWGLRLIMPFPCLLLDLSMIKLWLGWKKPLYSRSNKKALASRTPTFGDISNLISSTEYLRNFLKTVISSRLSSCLKTVIGCFFTGRYCRKISDIEATWVETVLLLSFFLSNISSSVALLIFLTPSLSIVPSWTLPSGSVFSVRAFKYYLSSMGIWNSKICTYLIYIYIYLSYIINMKENKSFIYLRKKVYQR